MLGVLQIGGFAKCMQQVQDEVVTSEDGGVTGIWLLTE